MAFHYYLFLKFLEYWLFNNKTSLDNSTTVMAHGHTLVSGFDALKIHL